MGLRVSITRQHCGLAMRLPRHVLGAAAVALLTIVAAGCSSATTTTTTTTTTTLPPLPPEVYAYVTMVGTGASLGLGHTVVPVEVSLGGNGPEAPLGVGTYPDAIAVTPDGKRAYVTNYTSNSVTPLDLVTGKVLPSIPLGSTAGPAGIAITPEGKTAYVTDAGAAGTLGDTITPIDLATDKTLPPITVGPGPQGIAITPDGRHAYVTDAGAFVPGQTGAIASTVTPVDLCHGKGPVTDPRRQRADRNRHHARRRDGACREYQLGQCVAYRPHQRQGRTAHLCAGWSDLHRDLPGPAHDRLCRRHHLGSVDDRQRDADRPHERHCRDADLRREEPAGHRDEPRRHDRLGRLLRQPDPRAAQHEDASSRCSDPPAGRPVRDRGHSALLVEPDGDNDYDRQGRLGIEKKKKG